MKPKVYVRDTSLLIDPEFAQVNDCPLDFGGPGWYSLNWETGWFVKGKRATFSRIWISPEDAEDLNEILGG